MINFTCNIDDFCKDLNDLVNLFAAKTKKQFSVNLELKFSKTLSAITTINNKKYDICKNWEQLTNLNIGNLSKIELKRIEKRFSKNALYFALSKHLNIKLPWGSLTGVKPVSLVRNLILKEDFSLVAVRELLQKEFFVSRSKVDLALAIISNQPKIISDSKHICVYVNIPFCPERCSYCSFVSRVCAEDDKELEEYVNALITEINASSELLKNKTITSLYVGGGTPSILNCTNLEKLLKTLSKIQTSEFVFECGRADTLTPEKIELLKKYGVTRICVNPQTFNEKVLKGVNRHIANAQVENVVKFATKNFIINSDLIAGLPGDTLKSFKKSVKKLINLGVDNISVHSLAIKRTSELFMQSSSAEKITVRMLEYAIKKLQFAGYKPYYLYRLKNTFDGLENIGFCKPGTECLFNICSMDERESIVAFGANGISKKIDFEKDYIDRVENPKDIKSYIQNLSRYIERKNKFFL